VTNNPAVQRFIDAHPTYVTVASELDLCWSSEPRRLFWQHERLDEWPM